MEKIVPRTFRSKSNNESASNIYKAAREIISNRGIKKSCSKGTTKSLYRNKFQDHRQYTWDYTTFKDQRDSTTRKLHSSDPQRTTMITTVKVPYLRKSVNNHNYDDLFIMLIGHPEAIISTGHPKE